MLRRGLPYCRGLNRPVNALNYYASVQEIVNISAITAIMAAREHT